MIKVLIADNHRIVRQGLRQILSDIPDMGVAGEADLQQGPGSGPDRRIVGDSKGRGGAITTNDGAMIIEDKRA